jgi:hypothetical protein
MAACRIIDEHALEYGPCSRCSCRHVAGGPSGSSHAIARGWLRRSGCERVNCMIIRGDKPRRHPLHRTVTTSPASCAHLCTGAGASAANRLWESQSSLSTTIMSAGPLPWDMMTQAAHLSHILRREWSLKLGSAIRIIPFRSVLCLADTSSCWRKPRSVEVGWDHDLCGGLTRSRDNDVVYFASHSHRDSAIAGSAGWCDL